MNIGGGSGYISLSKKKKKRRKKVGKNEKKMKRGKTDGKTLNECKIN